MNHRTSKRMAEVSSDVGVQIALLHRIYNLNTKCEQSTSDASDIILKAQSSEIAAHKSLLTAATDYFKAMFGGDFSEANRQVIELKEISAEGLQHVVDALYAGKLELSNNDVLEVLKTADQLEIAEVIDCCEDFLILGTDTKNCLELLQLSEKYTLTNLNQGIEQFVLRHFPEVCDHSLYPNISQEALVHFISNDQVDFEEITIFRGVMKWFRDDQHNTKQSTILEVISHIRFTYMKSEHILNEVLIHPLIIGSTQCKSVVEDALRYVIEYEEKIFERPFLEESNVEKPRGKMCTVCIPPKFALGEESRMLNVPAIKKLLFFGFKDDSLDMADMTECESVVDFAVFSMNLLKLGHSVFFIGAQPLRENAEDASMALLRFNVQSGEWTELKKPEFPPTVVSVSIIHDGHIYFFGGASYSNRKTIPQSTFQKECYRYSIKDNCWSSIANYPHPVSHPAACALENMIYVIGGGGSNENTWYRDRVFAYNPVEDNWTEKCPLNIGRAGHRVCAVDGKIYVLGGRDPNRKDVPDCEVYDPSTDQWTVLDNAPIPRSVASYAMVLNDENITLVGGGCDKETRHPLVQTFNTKEHNWTSYSWKNEHPLLLLSGSIHQLPLLWVRLSVCPSYNVQVSGDQIQSKKEDPEQDNIDAPQDNIEAPTAKPKSNKQKHCFLQ